jgi:hypothetical protein
MPGNGVRSRWTVEPSPYWPQNSPRRFGRLGHSDRTRNELPAQRGPDLAHSSRPKVVKR